MSDKLLETDRLALHLPENGVGALLPSHDDRSHASFTEAFGQRGFNVCRIRSRLLFAQIREPCR